MEVTYYDKPIHNIVFGHIFSAVVADSFNNRLRTTVTNVEAFTRHSISDRITPHSRLRRKLLGWFILSQVLKILISIERKDRSNVRTGIGFGNPDPTSAAGVLSAQKEKPVKTNHTEKVIDMVETIWFKTIYVLFIIGLGTRRIHLTG